MISVWFWRKFANRPLHLFGGTGIGFVCLGIILFIILFLARFYYSYSISDKIWPLVATLLIVVGVQLFVSGLIADIMVKNHFTKGRVPYVIKDIIQRPW